MKINASQFTNEGTVQIRALLVPKAIHEKITQDAANEMRTITAQTVAILINHYAEQDVKGANKKVINK